MAGITVDDKAFLAGLLVAAKELDGDGEQILHQVGETVVNKAKSLAPSLKQPDPRYEPGSLRDSIDMQSGRNTKGPWVDVGTDVDYAMFVEYGTYKDRPQPFMRPALNLAAKAIRSGGAKVSRGARRATATRIAKRGIIRKALRSGSITGGEARQLSREVSNVFRYRARRKRR